MGEPPRLQAKPSGGLRYDRRRARVSSGRPYGVCAALSLRVYPEVSQAGAARGDRNGGAGSDSGDLSDAGHRDLARAHPAGPCPSAAERPAASRAESGHAGDQGQDVPPSPAGPSFLPLSERTFKTIRSTDSRSFSFGAPNRCSYFQDHSGSPPSSGGVGNGDVTHLPNRPRQEQFADRCSVGRRTVLASIVGTSGHLGSLPRTARCCGELRLPPAVE